MYDDNKYHSISKKCTLYFTFSQELLKKGPGEKQFLLQHFQGTNPVLYNAEGWLQASREDGAMKAAAFLLQESSQ